MWEIVVALMIWGTPPLDIPLRPVSCIDGHIVETLSDCPPVSKPQPAPAPIGGGPHRVRGLLGLGGIAGIL